LLIKGNFLVCHDHLTCKTRVPADSGPSPDGL
jgi:hypothetical protein